jgi:ABC-type dipeptide/oligopeptide/nickel transport system permease component
MLTFFAFELIPGDPARSILGTEGTEEQVRALREEMGLNRPLPQRYACWIMDFLRGDMGESYYYQKSVQDLIGDRIPITVTMTVMAFVMILLLAAGIGILGVRHANRLFDRVFLVVGQVTMSIPPFFIGIMFTAVFGLAFRWFTPGGYVSYTEDMGAFLGYLLLPSLSIALPRAAMAAKLLRSSLLAEMQKDYVRTAYSRGNGPWRVLFSHVLKNGVLPVITFLGMTAADIIANSIVVEQVFGIPGVGRMLISSISKRDYPVVEAVIVLIAVVTLLMNTLVDLLYRKLDKRIEV